MKKISGTLIIEAATLNYGSGALKNATGTWNGGAALLNFEQTTSIRRAGALNLTPSTNENDGPHCATGAGH
ncbi:MAG: hypothetical protein WCF18_10825 [Chthoniobacteraceae bacterium]